MSPAFCVSKPRTPPVHRFSTFLQSPRQTAPEMRQHRTVSPPVHHFSSFRQTRRPPVPPHRRCTSAEPHSSRSSLFIVSTDPPPDRPTAPKVRQHRTRTPPAHYFSSLLQTRRPPGPPHRRCTSTEPHRPLFIAFHRFDRRPRRPPDGTQKCHMNPSITPNLAGSPIPIPPPAPSLAASQRPSEPAPAHREPGELGMITRNSGMA